MNRQLTESLNRLICLFSSAHERERDEAPLRSWRAATVQLEAARGERAGTELDRLGACLASLEGVVRCWRDRGFQASFRVAGDMLAVASGSALRIPAARRRWDGRPAVAQPAGH